jgi:hypothetical protein
MLLRFDPKAQGFLASRECCVLPAERSHRTVNLADNRPRTYWLLHGLTPFRLCGKCKDYESDNCRPCGDETRS